MQPKFKVGDTVRLKPSMFNSGEQWDDFRGKIAVITGAHYGQHTLQGEKCYRYNISIDTEPEDLWHPDYFELYDPPTKPKYRRIRL